MSKGNGFRHGFGYATRMVTEMTVATFLGAVMGYAVDHYFGTGPWGLAVGVIFGGAAGVLNVYRAAMEMAREEEANEEDDNGDKRN